MAPEMSLAGWIVWIVVGLIALAVLGAIATRYLVLRGLRTPWVLRLINKLTEKVVALVKRPITIAVLDEVADVIQTGHYTQNISNAIVENRTELKELVAEKLRHDPNLRLASRLPGYGAIVDQASETTLRVIIEMLGDPRMDELVSDLLRNNLQQIKRAVRARENEQVVVSPPGPSAPGQGEGPGAMPRGPRTTRS